MGWKMSREKKINIAINAIFTIILIAICTLAVIIKSFGGWVERFYIGVIEFYAIWKLSCIIFLLVFEKFIDWRTRNDETGID